MGKRQKLAGTNQREESSSYLNQPARPSDTHMTLCYEVHDYFPNVVLHKLDTTKFVHKFDNYSDARAKRKELLRKRHYVELYMIRKDGVKEQLPYG
jgi:hypothetical protein